MNIKNLLAKAGLEQHEIDLYLSLITLESATAGQLAKISGVPRTYTYKILESLAEKGFVQQADEASIRHYRVTDFEAALRYIQKQQVELYEIQQEAQSLSAQLQNMAKPSVSTAVTEHLENQPGLDHLWKLLHSTITREIWIVNPPDWWGIADHSKELKKWEQYRIKQHIWERLFETGEVLGNDKRYTERIRLKGSSPQKISLFLVDQYQVQVTSWDPFRALRIESQEMVDLHKSMLE
ncbi:MAG: helix-turn-helix domain-containing protein [bacterium]|nr:helix-turn-helix domain-containing protein [bacterium]